MSTTTDQATIRSGQEVPTNSRRLFEPALREAVATLPETVRQVEEYHRGWRDAAGRKAVDGGGKAVRPALTLACAAAVGGRVTEALPGAVAVELVHDFSLLQDDVMDGDDTRRHRLTAWRVFGPSVAVLAGDSLLSLAFEVLAGSGRRESGVAVRWLSAAVRDLVEGQAMDLAFERSGTVGLADCTAMAERKTAALISVACALGALFGRAEPGRIERLREFGRHLGLAFQLTDDLLGIWGDPAVTGKPVHADLCRGKKTFPVVAALVSGTPAGRELAELYRQPLSASEAEHAADLIALAGGDTWTRRRAERELHRALGELRAAAPVPSAVPELESLARRLADRDR